MSETKRDAQYCASSFYLGFNFNQLSHSNLPYSYVGKSDNGA